MSTAAGVPSSTSSSSLPYGQGAARKVSIAEPSKKEEGGGKPGADQQEAAAASLMFEVPPPYTQASAGARRTSASREFFRTRAPGETGAGKTALEALPESEAAEISPPVSGPGSSLSATVGSGAAAAAAGPLASLDALVAAARAHLAAVEAAVDPLLPFENLVAGAIVVAAMAASALLTFFRMSFVWFFAALLLLAGAMRRSRARMRRRVAREVALQAALVGLNDTAESVEWLNLFLSRLWAIFEPPLSAQIRESVDAVLDASKPAFLDNLRLTKFSLGSSAPRIDAIRTYPGASQDLLLMDWDISFVPVDEGDLSDRDRASSGIYSFVIELVARIGAGPASIPLPVVLREFSISGRLRIQLKFITAFPHVGVIDLGFVDTPNIDFILRPLKGMDLKDIPGLSTFISDTIDSQLQAAIVNPNKITINLEEIMNGGDAASDRPIGILRVSVYEARKLRNVDITGTSDPCAVVYIGGKEVCRTRVIDNSLNPVWNDILNIVITKSMFTQLVNRSDEFRIEVLHINPIQKRLIGATTALRLQRWTRLLEPMDLDELPEDLPPELKRDPMRPISRTEYDWLVANWGTPLDEPSDTWKRLSTSRTDKRPMGELRLDMAYFPVIDPQAAIEISNSTSTSLSAVQNRMLSGVLTISIHQAKDLAVSKSASPDCAIQLDGVVVARSPVRKHTNNPTWEFSHAVYCANIETSLLRFIVSDRGSPSGECTVHVRDILGPAYFGNASGTPLPSGSNATGGTSTSPTTGAPPAADRKDDWFRLFNVSTGRLRATAKFVPVDLLHLATDKSRVKRKEPCALLRINLRKAEGLINAEVLRKSDPYAKITVAGKPCGATHVRPNTLDPEWNEIFYCIAYSPKDPVLLDVYDWNELRTDKNIGRIEVPVHMVLPGVLDEARFDGGRGLTGGVASVIREQVNAVMTRLSQDEPRDDDENVDSGKPTVGAGVSGVSRKVASPIRSGGTGLTTSLESNTANDTVAKVGMSAAEIRLARRFADLRAQGLNITQKSNTFATVRAPLFISKSFDNPVGRSGGGGGASDTGSEMGLAMGDHVTDVESPEIAARHVGGNAGKHTAATAGGGGDEDGDDDTAGGDGQGENSGLGTGGRSIPKARKMSSNGRNRAREFFGRRNNAASGANGGVGDGNGGEGASDTNDGEKQTSSFSSKHIRQHGFITFDLEYFTVVRHMVVKASTVSPQFVPGGMSSIENLSKSTGASEVESKPTILTKDSAAKATEDSNRTKTPPLPKTVQELVASGASVEAIAAHVVAQYRTGILRIRINSAKLHFLVRAYLEIQVDGNVLFRTRTAEESDHPTWLESADKFIADMSTDAFSIVIRQHVGDEKNADDPVLAKWKGNPVTELLGRVHEALPMQDMAPPVTRSLMQRTRTSLASVGLGNIGGKSVVGSGINVANAGNASAASVASSANVGAGAHGNSSNTLPMPSVSNIQLAIEVSYVPVKIELDSATRFNTGILHVELMDAKDLLSADSNGMSDPYCNINLNGTRLHKTKVHRRTLNPVFNEVVTTVIKSRLRSTLEIQLMDWDAIGSHDALGRVLIHLANIPVGQVITQEFPVEDGRGVVRMRLLFEPQSLSDMERGGGGVGSGVIDGTSQRFNVDSRLDEINNGSGTGFGLGKFYRGLTSTIATSISTGVGAVAGGVAAAASGGAGGGGNPISFVSGMIRKPANDAASNATREKLSGGSVAAGLSASATADSGANQQRYGLEGPGRRQQQPTASNPATPSNDSSADASAPSSQPSRQLPGPRRAPQTPQQQETQLQQENQPQSNATSSLIPVTSEKVQQPLLSMPTIPQSPATGETSQTGTPSNTSGKPVSQDVLADALTNAAEASKDIAVNKTPVSSTAASTPLSTYSPIGSPTSGLTGTVAFEIVEARGLRAADSGGTSDPYVKVVQVNSEGRPRTIHKTSVVKKTLAPHWTGEAIQLHCPPSQIRLIVRDHNMFKSHVDLGHVGIDIGGIVLRSVSFDEWFSLEGGSGEIRIRGSIISHGDGDLDHSRSHSQMFQQTGGNDADDDDDDDDTGISADKSGSGINDNRGSRLSIASHKSTTVKSIRNKFMSSVGGSSSNNTASHDSGSNTNATGTITDEKKRGFGTNMSLKKSFDRIGQSGLFSGRRAGSEASSSKANSRESITDNTSTINASS